MASVAAIFGVKKQKTAGTTYAPSPDDERQRLAALKASQPTGGRSSTILTSGLAAPMPRDPGVKAPRTVLTS